MEKLIPTGHMILVKPLGRQNSVTKGGVELVNLTIERGEVVEVPIGDNYPNIYKRKDNVLYSKGGGHVQRYNGEDCVWLNAKGYPEGDIWAIIEDDKKKAK